MILLNKRIKMKKSWKLLLVILLAFFIIITIIYCIYADKNLKFLPKGELQSTYTSPNGKKLLNIYLVDGGLISANAIRGEIEIKSKKYNIYYCYRDCDFDVKAQWKNDKVVIINNIEIDINKDKIEIRP